MAVIELTPARLGVQVQAPPQARGGVNLGRVPAADPVAEAVGELGQKLSTLEEAAFKARQTDLVQQARARHITGLADLRGRLEQNDPAFAGDAVQAYGRLTAELRDTIAADIPDAGARSLFMREATLESARDRIEVVRFAARRTAESSRAQLDGELDGYAQAWMQATDPAARTRAIDAAGQAIAARVNSGALAADAGERLRQTFAGRIGQAQVLRDINTNPALALRNLTTGAYGITDPVQQERMASQARQALQTQASLSETAQRRQEAADRRAANEAEKAFRDALAAGDDAEAQRQLGVLRQRGQAGQYASAAERFYGTPPDPIAARAEAWLERRLRDRANPLTRDELDQARAARSINDTAYRQGLARLAAREDARFREAEDFVSRELEVPSSTIPDSQLQPAQREARRQANRIINDLMIERETNPDVNPLGFVRERLSTQQDAGRVVQMNQARAALDRMDASVRTPEGFAQVEAAWNAYQAALANRGWFSSAPPVPRVGGAPVTADMIARLRRLHEQAGTTTQGAPR